LPTREEFEEAVQILMRHEQLGPGIREQQLQPYPPMPPLLESNYPMAGPSERLPLDYSRSKGNTIMKLLE
jgi:hypothetical protein